MTTESGAENQNFGLFQIFSPGRAREDFKNEYVQLHARALIGHLLMIFSTSTDIPFSVPCLLVQVQERQSFDSRLGGC